mgnify:FL=1
MNIEKHRAFLDSLDGEKGLPEEMHGLRFDASQNEVYNSRIEPWQMKAYLWERCRRAESRQIPDLKERVKKFVDAAMDAEGRFWRSGKAAYIDAERGLFRAICAPEVKP